MAISMIGMMLTKTAFLLLAVSFVQVSSEYIEPQFIEDVIQEQLRTQSLGPRVVSGWDAILGQHPHQAHMRMTTAAGAVATCGGCFVHRDWMLTAAHCTATRVSLLIRGGMISLSETPEYMSETNEFWNYPTYDNSIPMVVQPNDISIVKLREPIVYTRNLQPIRIQPSADANRNYGDITLHASGFGATWTGGTGSQVLQWVYLRGISNVLCALTFGQSIVTHATICAQWYNVTSQSICQGDSGGPLVYTNPEGERILVGVTSFTAGPNSGGCHSGMPAAFIRPGHFHDWYTEVTGLDFENLNEDDDQTTTAPPTTLPPTTLPPTTVPPTTVPPTTVPPTTVPPTTVPPTTVPPTTVPPTTVPPTTVPPTTVPPTTVPPTTVPPTTAPPTTVPPPPEGEGEGSEEDDTSEEDEDLSELLKRLQVKVKVKVKVNEYRNKVRVVKKIQ